MEIVGRQLSNHFEHKISLFLHFLLICLSSWSTFIHWASREAYHFFRAALAKFQSIKMNHIWTQISYIYLYFSTSKKQNKGLLYSKRRNMWWNRKRSVFKNHRNCWSPGLGVLRRRLRVSSPTIESFCDIRKITFCDFITFFSFLTQTNLCFFRYSY